MIETVWEYIVLIAPTVATFFMDIGIVKLLVSKISKILESKAYKETQENVKRVSDANRALMEENAALKASIRELTQTVTKVVNEVDDMKAQQEVNNNGTDIGNNQEI